jgi:predicted ATPase
LRAPDASTYNLPVRLSSFVGREQELRTLEKMFLDRRLLTLVGAGGAGKTRLAIELARRVVGSMDDGVWFIDLAPVSEAKAVPSMIVDVLGLRDDGRRPLDQTVDFLRDRRALLVFDNCEHLIAIAANAVRSLLSRCPAIAVIATSREPLGIEGETPWRVPSLSIPRRDDPSPEEARDSEAVQLFVERARQAQVDFALGSETLADIAEVCRRLDGIPLAIELAAARVRMMSVGQIREGLMQRFLLLTGGLRTASPRHQTLRASVDWSYDLLGAKERILLARLSVFAGRFTLDSARVVAAGGDVRDVEILDLLAGLVDRSLIQVAERGSLMRYYLLETIRDYAVEQLAKAGELETVRDRHAAFFRSLVETAEPHLEGREQDAWADLLEQERPDLRSAVRWAGVRGDGDTAQRLVAALMWFFVIRAHMREGKALFDVALDTPGGSPATRARALQARSYLGWHRLEGRDAVALANEAAHLARQVGDRRTEARALYVAGFLTAEMGGQRIDLEASIALARETGDSWCLAHALGSAGSLGYRDGEGDRGQAFLRESVAVCEALGDSYIINTSRHWLGRSLLASGDRAAGTATLEAVIAHAQAVGDTFSLPMALTSLGLDHAFRGEEALGLAYLDEAAAIARPVGQPRFAQLANALWAKAIVLLAKQDPAAAAVLDEFMVLADRSGGAERKAFACAAVAMAAVLNGDTETVDVRLEEARTALSAHVPCSERAFVGMVAAAAARARGDFDAAAVYATQALASDPLCADVPGAYWTIEILETLAGALLAAGAARDAVRLRAAADTERHRIRRPRPGSYAQDLERDLAIARQQLGDPDTDAAWAEGSALPIEEAVAFALGRTL